MECRQIDTIKNCPCTYPDCERKGICCQCVKYHFKREELPACYFSAQSEKTYDRSFSRFASDQS